MKPILIVVAMCGRLDLAGLTLDMIQRQKSHLSDVLVLVDAKSDIFPNPPASERWPEFAWSYEAKTTGAAPMARERVRRFVEESPHKHQYLLTLDSDLLLAKNFDLRMMNLFLEGVTGQHVSLAGTLDSGYRSSNHTPIEYYRQNLLQMINVGGCCQFMYLDGAKKAFERMEAESLWHEKQWDHHWAKQFTALYAPVRSLAEHTGRHGSGHNGYSDDVAVGFELYD